MGLIRKAAEQGRQAMESIAKLKGRKRCILHRAPRLGPIGEGGDQSYDVVIVGAGPAGLSASLGAMEKKLRFVTIEQEDAFGGTVYHYPRNKVVMTAPVQLPIVGKMNFGEVSKEMLLEFWQGVLRKTGLKINFSERMETLKTGRQGIRGQDRQGRVPHPRRVAGHAAWNAARSTFRAKNAPRWSTG